MLQQRLPLNSKELALIKTTLTYFSGKPDLWDLLGRIIRPGSQDRPCEKRAVRLAKRVPSLRLICYYVSTFTRNNPTPLQQCLTHRQPPTTIHDNYKLMLRIHTKHRFDPFCRKQRRTFTLHGKELTTNVGQLVFFKWFFNHGVDLSLAQSMDKVIQARALDQQQRRRTKKPRVKKKCDGTPAEGARVIVSFDGPPDSDIKIAVRFTT